MMNKEKCQDCDREATFICNGCNLYQCQEHSKKTLESALKKLKPMTNTQSKIREVVRDLTKVGSIPKSEARSRIEELITQAIKAERERVIGIIEGMIERYPGSKNHTGNSDPSNCKPCIKGDIRAEALSDLKNKL